MLTAGEGFGVGVGVGVVVGVAVGDGRRLKLRVAACAPGNRPISNCVAQKTSARATTARVVDERIQFMFAPKGAEAPELARPFAVVGGRIPPSRECTRDFADCAAIARRKTSDDATLNQEPDEKAQSRR